MSQISRKMQPLQLPTLPEDVLQNILSRLPVKTLMRFKCVSKSIHSLINDPKFVKLHLDITKQRVFVSTDPPQIISLDEENGMILTMPVEYPSLIPADDLEIVGSCNGLLCVMDSLDSKFIVWNPSTRVCRELAKPDPLLACYPDVVPIYGFGYDSSIDDYKIIRAVSPDYGLKSTTFEICNLKDNVWRKMQASLPCIVTADYWRMIEPDFPGIFSRCAGVYANGAIHWLQKRDLNSNFYGSDIILSFNLAEEKFEDVIPHLEYDKEEYSYPSELRAFGGNLTLILYNGMKGEYEIWVMKEYGTKGSWTKIATMPNDPGHLFEDTFMGFWLVPFLSRADGCFLVDMHGREVLIYDPRTKIFSKIELGNNENLFLVQEFVESLVSPHGIDAGQGQVKTTVQRKRRTSKQRKRRTSKRYPTHIFST